MTNFEQPLAIHLAQFFTIQSGLVMFIPIACEQASCSVCISHSSAAFLLFSLACDRVSSRGFVTNTRAYSQAKSSVFSSTWPWWERGSCLDQIALKDWWVAQEQQATAVEFLAFFNIFSNMPNPFESKKRTKVCNISINCFNTIADKNM